jgi:hypothetical protein
MEQLSKPIKRKITQDWQSCFPAMSIFRSMWLLKRNGPILTGIALDGNRDNTTYRVIVHVHNLLVPTGFVSLTLWSPLQNRRGTYHESLTLRRHSLEFLDACNRLRDESPVPLTPNLDLKQIILAYEKYIADGRFLISAPIFLYRDVITLLTWCGKTKDATAALDRFIAEMSELDERNFHQVGGRVSFVRSLETILTNPELLSGIYGEQMCLLKVDILPDFGFQCL